MHTPVEHLRLENGIRRYSHQALEETLASMDAQGITCPLFFTCGLPFETREDLEEMVSYQRRLRRNTRACASRLA
jgi:radical SAM superfamily enzyme YgiQ (UPF0313 family)